MGVTGLLLGLAKERGLDGICLLGATSGARSDKDAGNTVLQFLLRVLGKEIKQGL
jgi:proteasome assembly chaperone (PAC2) family protein